MLIILDTDFTTDVHAAQRLRRSNEQSLSADAVDCLDEIFELLQYTGVARHYIKPLYIQRQLAALSQRILYVGIPVVATSVFVLWLYGHLSGAVLPPPVLEALVLVATVVGLAPLATLVSYVLCITTVTHRTASLVPFKIAEEGPL